MMHPFRKYGGVRICLPVGDQTRNYEDEEEGFDDHNLPQDFPDIVESADTAYHIAALHHNKLEPDPPLDPREKVRQELLA
jgi:hypothetical protein